MLLPCMLSGNVQIQSTMGTVKLAEVAKAAQGAPLMMFQLYVIKDRDFCRRLILGEPNIFSCWL